MAFHRDTHTFIYESKKPTGHSDSLVHKAIHGLLRLAGLNRFQHAQVRRSFRGIIHAVGMVPGDVKDEIAVLDVLVSHSDCYGIVMEGELVPDRLDQVLRVSEIDLETFKGFLPALVHGIQVAFREISLNKRFPDEFRGFPKFARQQFSDEQGLNDVRTRLDLFWRIEV